MTTRSRQVLTAVLVLVMLALGFLAGAWWLTYTQPGAKWGFERLGAIMPGRLDVVEMHGPLRGPLEIRGLTYRTDRTKITAEHVLLDWRLSELLRRKLDIYRLRADSVKVEVARDSVPGPLPDINLPVSIIVREGVVNRLNVTEPGIDSGLVIDRIYVDARSMRHDSLRVNHLKVESQRLDLDFAGTAIPRKAYPVALRGSWAYRMEGAPEVRGTGTLSGTMDQLHVVQDLSGNFTAHLDMDLFQPLQRMRYDGAVRFASFAPRDFVPKAPQGAFSGNVHVKGDVDALATEGSVHGSMEQLGPASAEFRMRRDKRLWYVDDLRVRKLGSAARFHARGTVAADTALTRFDLQTQWTGAAWPLQGEPWVQSERGEARLAGTPTDFAVHLKALLAGRKLPPGTWTLEGRGGRGRIAIRTVIADLLDGRIVGRGSVAWQPRVRWNLRFDGNGINPGSVWPQYPASLAFTGRSEGTSDRSGLSGLVLMSRIGGTLRGQPVSGQGTLRANHGQYALSGATLQWGPNRAQASGGFGRIWSLDWNLEAPRLSAALAQASGSLRGQGRIRGAVHRPRFTGTLSGDSLFFGTTHAGTLRASGDVDLAPGGVVQLNASATQVDAGGRSADRMIVALTGTRERHQLRASVAGRRDSTVAVLAGGFGRGGWRGALQTLDLVSSRAGNWSLAGPARLSVIDGRAELTDLSWRSGPSTITATADWRRRGPWRVETRLDQVRLSLLEPFLPPRIRLEGPLQGHFVAHATEAGRVFADLDVVPGPGQIFHETAAGQWVPTAFRNGRLEGTADGRRFTTTFQADLVNTGTIRGTLGWPAYAANPGVRQPIDGRVAIHMSDLSLMQGFTPELDATTGVLDADLAIGGSVQHPSIQGPVRIRNGGADVPRLGLQLRDADLQATGSPGGRLALTGSVRSGTGTLHFDGTAALVEGARPEARLNIKGDRIQAMNTRDMKFVASPDLHVVMNDRVLDVTGEVQIPEGTITAGRQDDRRLVKPSPDVVYSGTDTLSGGPEIHSRVRLVLGENVVIKGYGLQVRPTGSVFAIEQPGLPMLGRGELDIQDGTYIIYGQELQVESGRLVFAGGPITNPAVHARASRKAADGVTAGFDVSGTVMKPNVQVFSDPAMGQSEALSYVLFGKPIEKGNVSQGQLASTMAHTVGVPGANLLASTVASSVGIEQAKIEIGSSLQNTSLSLGTHLSPKLYLGYGMDVFDATSSIRLKYILNRIFTVEAEAAREQRVDVLYTVEP